MSNQKIVNNLIAQQERKTIQTFIYPIPFVSTQSSTIVIDVNYPVGKITFKPLNLCNLTREEEDEKGDIKPTTSAAFQEPLMLYSSLVNNQCVGLTGIYVHTNSSGNPISGYAITMPNDVVFQFKQPINVRGNYVFSLGSQLNGGAYSNTGYINNFTGVGNANNDIAPNANFLGAITVQIEFEEY
jgi:hypothetical protein